MTALFQTPPQTSPRGRAPGDGPRGPGHRRRGRRRSPCATPRKHGLILLTKNPKDFLELHDQWRAAGQDHRGLFFVYQDNDPTRDMRDAEIVRAVANVEELHAAAGYANNASTSTSTATEAWFARPDPERKGPLAKLPRRESGDLFPLRLGGSPSAPALELDACDLDLLAVPPRGSPSAAPSAPAPCWQTASPSR